MNVKMNSTKAIKTLPFPVYFFTTVLLAVIGFADSIYLSISHYRVYTDMGYKSFCAISRAINCDTISQSPYSIFLDLPVPVWGVIGYAFLLVCLLGAGSIAAGKIRLWSIIFWISLAFSCYSVILALISTYIIGSYCIMCILSYGVNLAILFYAWIIVRRFSGSGIIKNTGEDIRYLLRNKTNSLAIGTVFFVSLVLIWFYFPTYWNFQPPQLSNRIPRGVTASGDPWLGASRPVLQIIEFADYQCFQCKKMHFLLRQLVADNPDTIRIVHRNYPMDHQFNPIVKEPYHRGSGKMALLAIYAASKGKFWQMNDLLYQLAGSKKNIRVEAVAEALDLDYPELVRALNSRRLRYQLQKDIFSGNKLGISGTPAYVVDGKVYLGQIPAELLKTGMQN
jgi:protein-disulfide isomerase/uncharacterized membrane protein